MTRLISINWRGAACPPPSAFCGQYVNVNRALAHGAEIEVQGRPLPKLSFDGSYTYTSTQILEQPFAFDPRLAPGEHPLFGVRSMRAACC